MLSPLIEEENWKKDKFLSCFSIELNKRIFTAASVNDSSSTP